MVMVSHVTLLSGRRIECAWVLRTRLEQRQCRDDRVEGEEKEVDREDEMEGCFEWMGGARPRGEGGYRVRSVNRVWGASSVGCSEIDVCRVVRELMAAGTEDEMEGTGARMDGGRMARRMRMD